FRSIFGDGVYEVWRVLRGRLYEAERHRARLARGLSELRITSPDEAQLPTIERIAERLLRENDLGAGEATLYMEVTRGAAARTHYFPPDTTTPTVVLFASRFAPNEDALRDGVRVATFPDIRWLRCDVKTVQLLPNVLARQHAREKGMTEALFVRDGVLTEGTHTTLFGVLDGQLRTHPAGPHILPGVTRDVVFDLARERGTPVVERPLLLTDLPRVEELFLSGTTTDVTPIVAVDDQRIGGGVPGPVAIGLLAALRRRMQAAAG
ncbi:MAG: Aminotransferase, partial [Gemmatimonadetes bacterium]|nr:Aminotransferase [Gemmatimonadota bacterium]